MLDEEDGIKINVHRIYNLHFFDEHRASCLCFVRHYQIKKIENIMQNPFIKSSPFTYGSGFFPQKNIIMHLLLKKVF